MTTTLRLHLPPARWPAAFLGFPLGGLLGRAIAGPVDDLAAALAGGLLTGAVIGLAQWLAGSRALPAGWIAATAVGHAAGLALGTSAAGFGTEAAELALAGALTGLVVGAAQAPLLPRAVRPAWVVASPLLWALGWLVTTAAGVDVDAQWTTFGSTGAIVLTVLAGTLLPLGRR